MSNVMWVMVEKDRDTVVSVCRRTRQGDYSIKRYTDIRPIKNIVLYLNDNSDYSTEINFNTFSEVLSVVFFPI